MTKMIEIKTAMLGMGSVNRNLLKIIARKKDRLARDHGIVFRITAATDSSGIAIDGRGLDTATLVDHKEAGGRLSDLPSFAGAGRDRVRRLLRALDVDLLFEATPCGVALDSAGAASNDSRDSEALDICRDALARGVSVVLANKGPLVSAMDELRALARTNGTSGRLEYSATVCGGLPILNIGRRDMVAGTITKLRGVFNATSNFILDAMAGGGTFEKAVEEAQTVGAAEANPGLDTGGWDTAFKLLIVANTIMDANITLADISVEGIDHITTDMIRAEAERGHVIRLEATAECGGKFTVRPVSQPTESFLGSITGWEMGVEIHSDIYGISYHKLYEKEPIPTAASMMRDAVTIFCCP